MSALLVLSEARIAQEIRQAEEVMVAAAQWRRAWRRRVFFLTLRCAAIYAVGGALAWASLGLTGDAAQIALWSGLLLSNAGPALFAYAFWMREQGSW
ncbi:MAG: hypothetical protein DMD38_05510 [Gemmatimonadetes bacterium]|nr:MAG: hypothetical protein AUI86_11435 [Gemmatimonadetes bacterium 13_1_40CM_3_66_12]PYP97131.1 MAG: hypothetical protein DMD38_05510 [Gemmatimonadota bacterium]